jgi:hypothetical protein
MKSAKRFVRLSGACLVCLLGLLSDAHGQGVGSAASIRGTATDASGGVIPKATVIADDPQKGIRRAATTDRSGEYALTGLPPAAYDVTVEHSGFQTEIRKGLVLTVGQTAVLDFHLNVASVKATIQVTAELPAVETARGSQADTLTQQYITDLPIDRRDYLTFTLLLPGVSNSTRLADDQDFRVKQTPQSGLSFYGSNGRGNSVTVDGGEANDDSGSVRLTLSQDAVQEFQVNRSNYDADLGGASGASINIVSKSGTNKVHGSLYGYFRNDALDARDPFAFTQALQRGQNFNPANPDTRGTPVKNSLSRYQHGGTLGFPIHKDKTFLFVAFEGLRQNAENAVPLLTDTGILRPMAAQESIIGALRSQGSTSVPCINNPNGTVVSLPAAACAGVLQTALTVSQSTGLTPGQAALNSFLVNQFESNGGVFPYRTRQYLASGRLDHRVNNANQVYFTYRFGHDREESPDVHSLTAFSAGSSIHTYDHNTQGAWFHQFTPTFGNEVRLQWDYNNVDVIPNEPAEPGLQIPGFVNNLGTNAFLPNLSILRRYEFADNLTMIRGHHTIKFGGSELLRGTHTESHIFFPGRFVFGSLPGFLLSPQLATTTINSLQAASLGLPQVYQQGFGKPTTSSDRPFTAAYWGDAWAVAPNFTVSYGIRFEIDKQYLPLSTDYRDFAPRLSFAWDPLKDHKTVVRGGYGIFYSPIYYQIPFVDLTLGVLNKNHSTVENQNNPRQVPNQVENAVNTCGIGLPGVPIFPGNGTSPCDRQMSIYVDSLLPTGLPIQSAAVVFQTLFAQGLIQCTTPAPGNSACITPADVASFGISVANSGQLAPLTVLFSNPPNYQPPYSQQASLGIEREIANGFSISASFIYSHTLRLPVAIDTNLLPAPLSTVTLANGKAVSYRNWNLGAATDPLGGTEGLPCAPKPFACFVNPLIIQNNQYSSLSSALYEGGILEIKKTFSNHFAVFGNYTFSKAFDTSTDYNSDYGPQDPTNLGLDRGLSEFDERHKVVIAGVFEAPWNRSVLSGFELSPVFTYRSGLPFNLLAGGEVNGDNHATNERPIGAPRDTGLGPNSASLDMRLSWQHKLAEKMNLQVTAEGFNVANRTNYASVNNEVGPLFGLAPGFTTFNVHGSRALSPSTPLGFTSAFPKREIQLGVRLSF